ncbi:ABC transporter permease [Neobacillus dielmonensis]|uniref:ABC transporter permease n=1 Tax=Neobacillus dielmonensis TaxID=1347369 RepID=UPI0005A78CC0|nr:ABC transporter permease subunit [Neobacillus dielmonensis]
MNKWLVLFRKEWLEMVRNYKVIWLPLVFVVFGLLQPITLYYLPDILKNAGNMPEGTVIKIATPSSGEVLCETLSQFNQMGILVIVLAFMGIVAAERRSGMMKMILVKPVTYTSYILSKWVSALLLTFVSLSLGMLAAWYYTILLIGSFPFVDLAQGTGIYFIWISFLLTFTLFLSSRLKSSGLIAALALLLGIVLSLVTPLLEKWMKWSPAQLTGAASSLLTEGAAQGNVLLPLTITILLTALFLYLAVREP